MSVADNFDYSIPSSTRKDTMSLDTINSNDAKIRPFKKLDTQRDWSANLYNLDIEASSPKRFGIFTNKVDFINKVDDIERTNPKILHFPLNKPEYNLTNKDIEKSSPNMGNLHTNRCTNPLEPKYNLPKYEEYPPEIPHFIRDQIDISDIQGAKPQKYFQWKTRETFPIDNHGIECSKPKKEYIRKTVGNSKYHYLDYSDLTRDIFRTNRHIDPLDPVYDFRRKDQEPYHYGFIDKSKPQTSYPYFYPDPFNLKTNDINGTQTGSKNRINQFTGMNFNLQTGDIRGCSVGSLKKGISTNRNTNPLRPKYQYLGAKELAKSNNVSYNNINNNNINNMNNNNNNNINNINNINNNNDNNINNNNINNNSINNNNINNNNINNNNINNNNINNNINQNINNNYINNPQFNKTYTQGMNVKPSSKPPSKPASRPPSNPASRPPSKPASKPPSNPASRPPSNPVSRPPSRPPSEANVNYNKGNKTPLQNNEEQKVNTPLSIHSNKSNPNINQNFDYHKEFGNGYFNDKVQFNKENYVKPQPFYGFIHDKYVCSSENPEHLQQIEKEKAEKIMAKTTTGKFFNSNSNYSNNLSNFSNSNNNINNNNYGNSYNNNFNNNSEYNPGLSNNPLMNTYELNKVLNQTGSSIMSKTGTGFRKTQGKLSYAQQLDKFMETNKLKYIEPPKPEKVTFVEPLNENPPQPEPDLKNTKVNKKSTTSKADANANSKKGNKK